jgi:nucleotide-binding universal stress UspA family protein
VKKVKLRGGDPLKAILAYLRDHTTDLIVLATEGREGLPRWLRPSVAERLARRSRTLTLFVPNQGRGIVSLADGSSSLRRMLIPVDHRPSPQAALVYAGRAAARLGEPPVEAIVLHVGERDMPALELPEAEGCTWKRVLRSGEPIDEILRAVESEQVDLIVMATAGHDGILDALRGSVTEQVLRRAGCPLLAVPAA